MTVANKMRVYGEKMEDVKIIKKILRTLTEIFNYIVCCIEESKDIDNLYVDELQSSLIVHEQKFRKNHGEEQVLKVSLEEGKGRGRGRTAYKGRGRGRGSGSNSFNKATVECYRCHRLGHFQYECPSWNKEANYVKDIDEEEEMLLMSYVEENKAKGRDAWFIDSGCSNHMCGDRTMFSWLDDSFRQLVRLGNNTRMNVMGKESVKLYLNEIILTVTEVYYVPELKNNLLSVGQFQEKGLAILMQGGVYRIYHPQKGLIIKTNMSANRMFILLTQSQETSQQQHDECFHTSSQKQQNLSQLWHHRYGHLSYKGLRTLQSKKMVRGLPTFTVSDELCTDCIMGKHHRDAIPKKSSWRASQVLGLIHVDICGSITPMSCGNKKYTLCFIDDYSRKS